ncbi:MAG: hypothetical protein LBD80_07365, partial [Tannerella sp.]|nr:hypothetical protein [Tannerella sp.]
YFGGIRYDLIGRGYGIHSAIQSIHYYFQSRTISQISAFVLENNSYSRRLNNAIGFKEMGEKYKNGMKYIVLELYKEDFYKMHLVRKILEYEI